MNDQEKYIAFLKKYPFLFYNPLFYNPFFFYTFFLERIKNIDEHLDSPVLNFRKDIKKKQRYGAVNYKCLTERSEGIYALTATNFFPDPGISLFGMKCRRELPTGEGAPRRIEGVGS